MKPKFRQEPAALVTFIQPSYINMNQNRLSDSITIINTSILMVMYYRTVRCNFTFGAQ